MQIVLWKPPEDFVHNLINASTSNTSCCTTSTEESQQLQQRSDDDDDDDAMTDNIDITGEPCVTSLMTPANDDDDMDL